MKYIALIALLGGAQAIKLRESPDCPSSDEVFSHNSKSASAAGLYQVSNLQFETGMEGTEDLGEDIVMKGKPFHYIADLPICNGTNGKPGVDCRAALHQAAPAKEEEKKGFFKAAPANEEEKKSGLVQEPV